MLSSRSILTALALLGLALLAAAPAAQTPATPSPPNVVLIYGDDVGWGDLGCYGAEKIPTPHLDALAAAGLRFTDAHCTAATCSPSRFSLLTGVHGFRKNVRILPPDAPLAIPTDWLTLPRLFRESGFDTAVVGKWHLGLGERGKRVDWNADVAPGPLELGFGYSFLLPSTNDRVPCVYLDGHRVVGLDAADPLYVGTPPADFQGTVFPDGKQDRAAMTYYPSSHGHNDSVIGGIGRIGRQWGGAAAVWNDETMADVFVDRAKAWLTARRNRPFFLFFSSQDIHVPRTPHPRFRGRSQLSFRGDAMVQLDWAVGQLLTAIDATGHRENTIVIFASDNGPVYDDGYVDGTTVRTSTAEADRGHDGSGPFRGGKYQVYEGGTRTPLIVRWPARIRPGVSHALVSQIDFLASFAALLGKRLGPEQAIDSQNQLPALLGEDPTGAAFVIEEARRLALRSGRWKYVRPRQRGRDEPGEPELYDLATDPGETRNLAPERPDLSKQLQTLLDDLTNSPQGLRAHG